MPVYYAAFQRAVRGEGKYPETMEGCANFFADDYAKTKSSDEVNRRRQFYFYLAALLRIAHARAERQPELWNGVAATWVALLPGAQVLRGTIDKTALWKPTENEYFSDVKTEDDGLRYCLALMAPQQVRYHNAVNA